MTEKFDEKFSVFQFFPDETYEKVRDRVSLEESVRAAHHYTTSVGAQIGTTVRVIVVDSGDSIVFEWRFGLGIIFPPSMAVGPKGVQ